MTEEEFRERLKKKSLKSREEALNLYCDIGDNPKYEKWFKKYQDEKNTKTRGEK